MSVVAAEAPERPSTEAKRVLLVRLSARFGNRFSAGTALREQHANTLTWIACQPLRWCGVRPWARIAARCSRVA